MPIRGLLDAPAANTTRAGLATGMGASAGEAGKGFCGVRGDSHARAAGAATRRGRMFDVLDTVDFGASPAMIKARPGLSGPPCHDALARLIGSHRGSAVKDARKRWHDDKVDRASGSAGKADESLVLSAFLEEKQPDLACTIARAAQASQIAKVEGRRILKVRGRRASLHD